MAMLLLPRRRGGLLLMVLQLAVTADAFAVPRSRSLLAPPRRASLRGYLVPDDEGKIVLRDGDPRILFGSGDLEGNPHFAIASPDPIEVWCDGSYDPRTESGGAGVVIPGDASSGRWLMQAHIPEKHRFGRPMEATSVDAEWIAVHLGLYALLQRFELWPSWYDTEYRGGPPPRQVKVFSDLETLVETCNCFRSGKPVEARSKHILSTLEVLEEFYTHGVDVTFEWVKSRSGLALHDLADELAREASVVNKENLYAHYFCRV